MPIYACRDWYLNTEERRIIKNGTLIELTPKSFDVVNLLIEHRGETVSKDQILGEVWNGNVVEEGNLPVHISKIRRLLGDSKEAPIVETVAGLGYRFVGPLRDIPDIEWMKLTHKKSKTTVEGEQQTETISVAVSPFENLTDTSSWDFLIDGVSESLLNSLSQQPAIKVIGRHTIFRYKASQMDPEQLGLTLGVDYVVSGRFRLIDSSFHISVEITRIHDGTQIWGASAIFPVDQIAQIQGYLDWNVRRAFNNAETAFRNQLDSRRNESIRYLLKARYLMQRREQQELENALAQLERAMTFDPNNVEATVESIECNLLLFVSGYIGRETAESRVDPLLARLKDLHSNHDRVLTASAGKLISLDWNFHQALDLLRRSLLVNPNNLLTNYRLVELLISLHRFDDAASQLDHLLTLDPMSVPTYITAGRSYYRMGRFEIARTLLLDALELEPDDFITLAILGACCIERCEFDEGISYLARSFASHPHPEIKSMLAYCSAILGDLNATNTHVEELTKRFPGEHHLHLARVFGALGDPDRAFQLLEQSVLDRDPDLRALNSDPRWRHINSDSRFTELLNRIGLTR